MLGLKWNHVSQGVPWIPLISYDLCGPDDVI